MTNKSKARAILANDNQEPSWSTDSVYDLQGRPVLRAVNTNRKTLMDRILR